ncbi:MAG: BamA/TamA family outer membrane protein [Deltaproteobacteria bacterium]|nr:BamA/TamA family outer membrane protein [Deltaproteobacteria bacterium]
MADHSPGRSVSDQKKVMPALVAVVRILARISFLLVLLFSPASGRQAIAETADGITREAVAVSKIEISIRDYVGSESDWRQIADDIISLYIEEGDTFSAVQISASLSALKECGKFRTIDADSAAAVHGITLLYALTPFKRIKEIKIEGKYPLFESKVLNAMAVYPGDAYVQSVVDAQPEIVAELFRKEGYIAPDVVIGAWEDPDDSKYILFVNIAKGPYYTLGNIVFKDNATFDDSVLKWRMKSWRKAIFGKRSGRFKKDVFRKDINNVRNFYRKRDFFDVRISYELNRNPATGMVDAAITVQEGPRYNITFQGNEKFRERTLRKQLVLVDTGNRGNLGLRKSIKKIKSLYRGAGFPQSRIVVEAADVEDNGVRQRDIRLLIQEGPRFIVNRLDIAGNSAYSEAKLNRQVLTRIPGFLREGAFVPETLEEDLLMIENLYHKKGYMSPEISVSKVVTPAEENRRHADREVTPARKNRHHVEIDLTIDEGVQTVVSALEFEGLVSVPPKRVLKKIKLKAGRPLRQYELNNDERSIAEIISEAGHPYVTVEGRIESSPDRSAARVTFVIDEGPYITMGNTYYNGNFRTKKRILDRELEMAPGDAYSLKSMHTGQKNMRSMDIFRSVQFKPVGLKDQKEKIHLFADVDEKPPFFFQANGGFESVKGFYVGSRLGDHNFLGLNKDAWIGGEISQTGYWAESRLYEPRFFGTRISSDLGIFFDRDEPFNQTFGTETYGVDLFFSRKLTHKITGNLGFRYERREQFSRGNSSEEDDGIDVPRSIFIGSPSISYDTRDSFVRPREGIFSFLAMDLSKGIENSLDDYYKYRFEIRGFTTPVKRVTFAGKGSFGDIDPYGPSGIVPQDQLFFLGGTASVRGFDENLLLYDSENNPVGGEMAAVASAEARLDLGRNFELSIFYDVGYLDDTSGLAVTDNVRDSIGTGLRYVTPIGAIGVLYGHKLDPRPDESPGRFHLSIGYTF